MQSIYVAIFLLSLLSAQAQIITPNNVVEVVGGLIEGVVKRDELDEVKQCFSGTEDFANLIDVAVREFKNGGIIGISTAILETAKLIEKLPKSLERCVNVSKDVNRFVQWAQVFLNPAEIGQRVSYNMLFKFANINGNIQEGLKAFDKKEFARFGIKLGESLAMAVSSPNGEF